KFPPDAESGVADAPTIYSTGVTTPGAAGIAFTATVVVAAVLVHPFTVIVALYVPAIAVVAFVRDTVRVVAVYPFGPVHAYVAPVVVGTLNVIVSAAQRGLLLVIVGVAIPVVVLLAVVLCIEVFPAASFAITYTEYCVLHCNPV